MNKLSASLINNCYALGDLNRKFKVRLV